MARTRSTPSATTAAAAPKRPKAAAKPATKRVLTANPAAPPSESIRELAYFLWQAEGCPADRKEAHWLAAEAQLRG